MDGTALTTSLMFLACLAFAFKMMAARWELLAEHYAGEPAGALLARKGLESIVLEPPGGHAGRYAFNAASVAVHRDGLALRGVAPLHWFRRPLFLPFADMSLRPTYRPGLSDAQAVTLRNAGEIELILGADQVRWMREAGAAI